MNAGYVLVPAWLLDLKPDGAELRVYCTLATFGRFDTVAGCYEECRPALSTLAERAGMSTAHAKRAIQGLLLKKAITRSERWAEDGKTQLPSVYRVIFGRLVGPGDEPGGFAGEPRGGSTDEPRGGSPVSQNPEPDTHNQNTQKKNTSSASPRRGTRLPEPFEITDSMRTWYVENIGRAIDGKTEHEKFLDYWRAQPGAKGVKVDWPATWRNWMRTAMERSGSRPTSGAPAGAAGKPRFPNSAERQQQQSRSNTELAKIAEEMVQAQGSKPSDPEHATRVIAVFKRLKAEAAQTGGAPRTAMPYIEGEVVRATGALREVTSGGAV